MSNFTTLYNTGGLPTGTILRGEINDPTWLPMNGGLYLKADYPELNTTDFLTFGNNTVQTATGSVTFSTVPSSVSFAHNTNYSMLAVAGDTNSLLYSTNGGLAWANVTTPITVQGVAFLNNQFVVWNPVQFSTSSDLVNWSAATNFNFPNPANRLFMLEFFNNTYIAFFQPVSAIGIPGIFTNSSLSGSGWVLRGSGVSNTATWTPWANNGLLRGVVRGSVLYVAYSEGSSYQICSTTDAINFQRTSTSSSALMLPNSYRLTDSDFAYNTTFIAYSRAATEVAGTHNFRVVGSANANPSLTNFKNLFALGANTGSNIIQTSESKYLGNSLYGYNIPITAANGIICFFTPSRLIIIPSSSGSLSVYYINIDTTRFRLERPFMDGQFVDDAYIKAA